VKRYSLFIIVMLAFLLAIGSGSTVLAGSSHAKKDKAQTSEKVSSADSKDKAPAANACATKDSQNKGQCTDACKSTCTGKTAGTKKQCTPCKPGECAQPAGKAAKGK
jgi:hypothetical protein